MQKSRIAPMVENLEDRRLFSAANFSTYIGYFHVTTSAPDKNGELTLSVTGTAKNDTINITYSGLHKRHEVTVNTSSGLTTKTIPDGIEGNTIKRYSVNGRSGFDTLTLNNTFDYATGASIEKTLVNMPYLQSKYPASREDLGSLSFVKDSYTIGTTTYTFDQEKNHQEISKPKHYANWFFGDSFAQFFVTRLGKSVWTDSTIHDWSKDSLNLGMAGQTTGQMISRIRDSVDFKTLTHAPDRIFLMAGTNEFNRPYLRGTDRQIADGIIQVARELHANLNKRVPGNHTQIILLGLTPERKYGINTRVEAVNKLLAQHAKWITDPSKGFRFENGLFETFTPKAGVIGTTPTDRIGVNETYFDTKSDHLSANGYKEVSKKFKAWLPKH